MLKREEEAQAQRADADAQRLALQEQYRDEVARRALRNWLRGSVSYCFRCWHQQVTSARKARLQTQLAAAQEGLSEHESKQRSRSASIHEARAKADEETQTAVQRARAEVSHANSRAEQVEKKAREAAKVQQELKNASKAAMTTLQEEMSRERATLERRLEAAEQQKLAEEARTAELQSRLRAVESEMAAQLKGTQAAAAELRSRTEADRAQKLQSLSKQQLSGVKIWELSAELDDESLRRLEVELRQDLSCVSDDIDGDKVHSGGSGDGSTVLLNSSVQEKWDVRSKAKRRGKGLLKEGVQKMQVSMPPVPLRTATLPRAPVCVAQHSLLTALPCALSCHPR